MLKKLPNYLSSHPWRLNTQRVHQKSCRATSPVTWTRRPKPGTLVQKKSNVQLQEDIYGRGPVFGRRNVPLYIKSTGPRLLWKETTWQSWHLSIPGHLPTTGGSFRRSGCEEKYTIDNSLVPLRIEEANPSGRSSFLRVSSYTRLGEGAASPCSVARATWNYCGSWTGVKTVGKTLVQIRCSAIGRWKFERLRWTRQSNAWRAHGDSPLSPGSRILPVEDPPGTRDQRLPSSRHLMPLPLMQSHKCISEPFAIRHHCRFPLSEQLKQISF